LRERIREVIITLVKGELSEILAALPYQRTDGRRGYRHGSEPRTITTGLGATTVELPRGRLRQGDQWVEWRSTMLPRYERRARAVDAAVWGAYLTGANQRRIKGALAPLLRGAPLSKSAISRLVGRVKSLLEQWRKRSLAEERCVYLYLDAIALRVRLAQKVVTAPVLVTLGVRADGQKAVLDLEVLTSEATTAWQGLLEGLSARGLRRPRLCVIDGNPGLRAAVEGTWPGVAVQRCTVHKLRNLERHAPKHAIEEVRTDYREIVYAETLSAARQAYRAFVSKWRARAPKVVVSLEEAGEELLTFYRFPASQWKSLRTTNAIERLHGEFRRRVKTQGALPTAQAAELLLFGLIMSGQIRMRRIDGWRDLTHPATDDAQRAA
jgi:transposase-like protein